MSGRVGSHSAKLEQILQSQIDAVSQSVSATSSSLSKAKKED